MDEQLDNDLSNRIREVFDNFDEPHPSADEGWLLLRNKFPEMEKKRPVTWLWWASAAAAILLFATIGLWMLNKEQKPDTLALKPAKQQHKTLPADTDKLLTAKQTPSVNNNQTATKPASTTDTNTDIDNASKTPVNNLAVTPPAVGVTDSTRPATTRPGITQPLNNAQIAALRTRQADSAKAIASKANAPQYAVTSPSAVNSPVITAPGKNKPDSAKTFIAKTNIQQNTNAPVASNKTVAGSSSVVIQQPVKVPKAPANSMATLFANEKAEPQKHKEDYTEDKKVRFGVYAATFFNYAKGSTNQVNAGAGFTSDIKLSKNFKLSTGVALAQNTLSYNGGPPVASNTDALARAPQALAPYDKQSLYSAANASFPVLKNYNASLIGLDIPMNIKYEFNPQKNDTYVSAGLSSGTFINEAYTSVYSYPASSVAAGASAQTSDDVTRKNFSGFYIAKTLNVSFGVGYPIGKGNKLIIEPFLKYPLAGLGSQQIQFGAAGLNLKLNFTSPKK